MKGGNEVSVSGAKPHWREDEVLSPNKLISALPASNQEPTLSVELRIRRQANKLLARLSGSPSANCVTPLPLVASLPPSNPLKQMTLKPSTFILPFVLLAALTSSLFADTVKAPSAADISRLIAQLGDDDCMVRNNAQEVLTSYGGVVKAELEKALETVEDPEIHQRLEFILNMIPLVWDEPGDEPELSEFIQKYRRTNNLTKMVALEQLRRLPMNIQIKILDRLFQKEQNPGLTLFAAMEFWYWRPEPDSPQFAQLTQAVNEFWKDSKHPAVKNLYYLINYKQVRAEASIWFDNQTQKLPELNRIPSKSIELIPEYVGTVLAEFARRNAESQLTDADLAGEKKITFPTPRFGSSSVVIVNGAIQKQFSIRSQVLSSISSSIRIDRSIALVPLLGPIYLFHQGMEKEAEEWVNWEFSNQTNITVLGRKAFAEHLHEYGFNKAAANILEQKNSSNKSDSKEQAPLEISYITGYLEYYRACQAKQENNPEKQWKYLLESLNKNDKHTDSLIMQWELCHVPANENKIAAITDDVRKQVDESIEKYLSSLDEEISNNGMDSSDLLNNYAWLAVKTNRHLDKALTYAKEAVEIDSASAACLDTLAHAYAAEGNIDKAIELQQQVVKQDPVSQMLYTNLLNFKKLKETVSDEKR